MKNQQHHQAPSKSKPSILFYDLSKEDQAKIKAYKPLNQMIEKTYNNNKKR